MCVVCTVTFGGKSFLKERVPFAVGTKTTVPPPFRSFRRMVFSDHLTHQTGREQQQDHGRAVEVPRTTITRPVYWDNTAIDCPSGTRIHSVNPSVSAVAWRLLPAVPRRYIWYAAARFLDSRLSTVVSLPPPTALHY